jgi:predicted lipoprotein with Yx(FWY)xxD motif
LNLGENNAMKKSVLVVLAAVFAVAMLGMTASAVTTEETITGMLVEAGCAAMGGTNPSAEHVACMVKCARSGDPIGILTDDGLYKITGNWASENSDKLAEWMAKQVHATGETSQAGGELLLEVSTIEPVR